MASDLDKSLRANQVNTLIYCMGDKVDDVLEGLTITAEQKLVYDTISAGSTMFLCPRQCDL